ncbi:MAG TPA: iron-containing alcohol dehydrogenase [Solirubrobacteraceae bacterium]|nr:iron-containing alcohol dehydrogenase [Solirubrobacteraceae bacterium]
MSTLDFVDLDALRATLASQPGAARLTSVDLGGVVLGEDALSTLPAQAAELRDPRAGDVAVLMDRRPMTGPDGTELKQRVQELLGEAGAMRAVELGNADADVHADPDTLAAAAAGVDGAALLVTVGSGTLTDIGKHTSHRLGGLPHIVVQTAASVNGFADDQSVLVIEGVKRTTPSRWPDRLIIDTGVIAHAPVAMNRAGLGDLLATYTAPADWLLARFMGQDDSFSAAVVALARDRVDAVLEHAAGIGRGDRPALKALAAALTLSGISMGAAGRTAPGSGMEHTCSHLIEMTERGAGALHGAQVGVLSVFAACLWRRVRDAIAHGALSRLRFPDHAEMRARVGAAFASADPSGGMAAECWRDYRRKLERHHGLADRVEELVADWPRLDAGVERLLGAPERLSGALAAAGAPTRLGELGIEPERARWALANCHLMRDRFTIADLAFLLGLWDADGVDAVVEMAERAGAGV